MLVCFAGYVAVNALIGLACCARITPGFARGLKLGRLRELFSPPVREASTLTIATSIPYSLEHIDKMIVSALFGNSVLGIYTLGFSAGRFLYTLVKPTIFIYYYHFVTDLPGWRLLAACFAGGTVLGGAISWAMWWLAGTNQGSFLIPALPVNSIVLWSYGIALVSALYSQAVMINERSRSGLVLIASVTGGVVCLLMFGVAAALQSALSLILLAAHFPLRHLISFAITWYGTSMSKRSGA
jgi:hypothetical protein